MKVLLAILCMLFVHTLGGPNRFEDEYQLDSDDTGESDDIDSYFELENIDEVENVGSNSNANDEGLVSESDGGDKKKVSNEGHRSSKSKKGPIDRSPESINEIVDGEIQGPHHGEHVDHGDIMFRPGEEEYFFGTEQGKDDKQVNDAIIHKHKRWPMPYVPYVIESSLGSKARIAIGLAIAEYNLKTCIRFVPRSSQANYLSFFKSTGCWSYVGMSGGKQQISIGYGCEYKKTAVHEIMHAMGFWHEQSRPDRDNYVTINWDNIADSKMRHNFNKKRASDVTDFGHGYDYHSVMHYSKTAFGKTYTAVKGWWFAKRTVTEKKETITPKVSTTVGQCFECGMSMIDALQLNHMYCNSPKETVARNTLVEEMKRFMVIYNGQSNDDFRNTLLNDLKARYPKYDWTVSSYAAVSGYGTHAFIGYCGHVWRYYNRNVVACYSKKSTKVPSWSKQKEIANAALREVTGKGCDAKSGRDRAWKTALALAEKEGSKVALIHNVRWGSGLRVSWQAWTHFFNYKCEGNHMSSLVIMFGSP